MEPVSRRMFFKQAGAVAAVAAVASSVAVLIFGGSAIPKFARSLGEEKNEFEKGMSTVKGAKKTIADATLSELNAPRTRK